MVISERIRSGNWMYNRATVRLRRKRNRGTVSYPPTLILLFKADLSEPAPLSGDRFSLILIQDAMANLTGQSPSLTLMAFMAATTSE